MPAVSLIRTFDAVVDDVNPKRKSITARINTSARDRHNTVILPKGCRHKTWRANGGPVLWEHGRDRRFGTDLLATSKELWNNGGPNPTEIIAEPVFMPTDWAQERYEWYRDGLARGWSISAIPTPGSYGPPTMDELRRRPDWEGVECVYRDWDLAEFSGTIVPSNPETLTCSAASKVMTLVERGLLWLPDEAEPIYREASTRTAVSIPRATTDGEGGLAGGGATVKPDEGEPDDAGRAAYGMCPRCGAPGVMRERRPDGNDRCSNGHEYPSKDAVMPGGEAERSIARHVREEDGKWYVYNEDNTKRLGGPYSSRAEADERLGQIEYFKHHDADRAGVSKPPCVPAASADDAPDVERDEPGAPDEAAPAKGGAVRKRGNRFVAIGPDGKRLGEYDTREEAEAAASGRPDAGRSAPADDGLVYHDGHGGWRVRGIDGISFPDRAGAEATAAGLDRLRSGAVPTLSDVMRLETLRARGWAAERAAEIAAERDLYERGVV